MKLSKSEKLSKKPMLEINDISPVNGSERILINFAITIMRRLKKPLHGFKNVCGLSIPTIDKEAEQELVQFVIKWDKWPVPEKYVDKAIEDMGEAIKNNLKSNGFMR